MQRYSVIYNDGTGGTVDCDSVRVAKAHVAYTFACGNADLAMLVVNDGEPRRVRRFFARSIDGDVREISEQTYRNVARAVGCGTRQLNRFARSQIGAT